MQKKPNRAKHSSLFFSLKLFFVIALVIAGLSTIPSTSVTIYGQNDAQDLIQIYYPEAGEYSENHSVAARFGGNENKIELFLPKQYSFVRIDPGTRPGDINISRIEVKNLFLTDSYESARLLEHMISLVMINEIKMSPKGIIISSAGNDPSFEFRPDRGPYSPLFQLILLGLLLFAAILLIRFIFKGYGRALSLENSSSIIADVKQDNILALLVIVFIWSIILYGIYPGFMSYDSLHALREARGIVKGGTYPPFVSYVWRIFDLIWPGPTLMLIVQNFLMLISMVVLLGLLGYKDRLKIVLISIFALLPPILGPMMVVWKDVSVAACFCAAIALFQYGQNYSRKFISITFGVLFLFMGAAFRFNAIAAVAPLLALLVIKRYYVNWTYVRSTLMSVVIFFSIFILVGFINSYRIPTFEKLNRNGGFEQIMMYDLIGISALAKRDILQDTSNSKYPDNVNYLSKIYDSRHINITIDNDSERRLVHLLGSSPETIRSIWLSAVVSYPNAYFLHRFLVFRELVGAVAHPQFYPTHGQVDANEYGISGSSNYITRLLMTYIALSSNLFFCRPWFYYIVGALIFLKTSLKRKECMSNQGVILCILASGYLYIAPFFFISPAADLRYNLWGIVAMLLALIYFFSPNSRKTS